MSNTNFNNNPDNFDFDDNSSELNSRIEDLKAKEGLNNKAIDHLRKYARINDDAHQNMVSRSSQENIYADAVEKLTPEQRLQKAMDIYIETINRNLPEIDQNLVRNMVNDTVEGMLPLVFKASEEIKHRYEDTGKFEGYEHPAIKAIIEKHLMSAHNSSKSTFKKIMTKLGTPMHEIFGKGNHVMGEQGKVYNNVHTAVTRGGTIFAAGLAIKELSTLFPVYGAVPLAGILFTMTQAINEVTNEAEHTTLEKKNPAKIFTKWTTIAAAKAAPIALLAISSMGGISPNLEQNYLNNEGTKLYTEVVERSKSQAVDGKIPMLQAKLKEIDDEIAAKELLLSKTGKGDPMRETLLRELNGAQSKFMQTGEIPLKQQKKDKEKEIDDALKANADLITQYQDKGPVNFIIQNANLKYGGNEGASARFRETINDYSKLDAAARISNGWDYMGKKITHSEINKTTKEQQWRPELTDELFTMIYIAMLVESLSVITLLLVQSRADFRKVITNSDSQKALASIIEGAILLQKQVAAETDFNEFRSDEDKLLTQNASTEPTQTNNKKFTQLSNATTENRLSKEPEGNVAKFLLKTRKGIIEIKESLTSDLSGARVEPPSYSSLVKSVAVQQAVQEMYRDGHVPSMNQVIHDISRDLIKPIPVVKEKKKKTSAEEDEEEITNAQKLKEVSRNEQLENNPGYAATLPKKLTMAIEKDVIGGRGKTMDVMKHNLENLLARYVPLNEKVMREQLNEQYGEGKVEKYNDMIRSLKEAIAELGYTLERNDASEDRMDLKNKITEDIKNAIANFENNREDFVPTQNYANTPKEMRENLETEESHTPMNYQRMEGAIAYIKGEMGFNNLTPELLVKMVDILRKGGAVHHYTKGWGKDKQNDMLDKIEELMLASPFQPAIQDCMNKMQIAATEELAKVRRFGIINKQAFKTKISEIIVKYEKTSVQEQAAAKLANLKNKSQPQEVTQPQPENKKSKFDEILDEDDIWGKDNN